MHFYKRHLLKMIVIFSKTLKMSYIKLTFQAKIRLT